MSEDRTIEVHVLQIDDDYSTEVDGVFRTSDAAEARLREYLVDRFGEDEVVAVESASGDLAELVPYRIDAFEVH